MPHNEESDNLDVSSHANDAFLPLDTIQEDREGSLSGESSEYAELPPNAENISREEVNLRETDDKKNIKIEEKKINVQWMNEDEEDEEDENDCDDYFREKELSHPDVDGGWAWVVLFSVFSIFLISAGLLASTGLFYVQMLREFRHSRSCTAWMGSLMNAFFMLAGPICSMFIRKAGCRASIMLGSFVMMIGYLMSAFAQSLFFIFFSYGIVVACGMNFAYCGQIIALAQYFKKRHSLATSASMVGTGLGIFSMIRLLDFIVSEYGWRGSFIFCAGISLQLCIFGSMILPLPKNIHPSKAETETTKLSSQEELDSNFVLPSKHPFHEKAVINRSVSSLRLSIGAGYLSSSLASLNQDSTNKHLNAVLGSNQNSFCSRGSHYHADIRSNQQSFQNLPNSHSELTTGFLPSIKSNQHSFCSKESFYGIHGLRSNPHSFSNKNSQGDLHYLAYHHCLPSLKDVDQKAEKDSLCSSSADLKCNTSMKSKLRSVAEEELVVTSKYLSVFMKIKFLVTEKFSDSHLQILLDKSFWFLNLSMFFTMLSTSKLFVIYKDFSESLGVGDYYSLAMSVIGVGDMIGRVTAGVLASMKWTNPIIIYSVAMIICGIVIGLHLIATSGPWFLCVAALFGISYGQQNVLLAIAPGIMFGKDMLLTVFGYILFFAGLGALIGAPIAGYIVDTTGSYNGVIALSVSCCLLGGFCMFLCYVCALNKQSKSNQLSVLTI